MSQNKKQKYNCSVSMQNVPHWTQQLQSLSASFQSMCVGFGAILAGFGGLKIGLDWLDEKKIKRKKDELMHLYPDDLDGKSGGFRIVLGPDGGKWWLLDERDKSRHWIKNGETARDLGWGKKHPKKIQNHKLQDYQLGDILNTKEP